MSHMQNFTVFGFQIDLGMSHMQNFTVFEFQVDLVVNYVQKFTVFLCSELLLGMTHMQIFNISCVLSYFGNGRNADFDALLCSKLLWESSRCFLSFFFMSQTILRMRYWHSKVVMRFDLEKSNGDYS
ncbi:hypothetical protein KFK09_012881 [Dendrobium nobile]|uniref:Uncharacterized protein n=1 Tax=Dendrobium nobile TaxID=94219 RepID=A0A8T3BIK4_DENNO|nr:hypothetical protein KFK09_012881 [Dendrobium nobile]